MAIYRTIQVSFWTDNKVVDDFTPEDKYFYMYLFSNPQTNLCGCYEVSLNTMSNQLGYTKDTIERLLDRFETYHKVIKYSKDTKEILLLNWHKYNWQGGNQIVCIDKEIDTVKNEEFRNILIKIFNEKFSKNKALTGIDEGACKGLTSPHQATVSVYYTDTVINTVNREPKKAEKVKHKYGEYNNVLLTDEELEKLKAEYSDYKDKIEALSNYIASKGAKYKSHYATIRNWARKEKQDYKAKSEKWGGKENQREIDFDEYEKMILSN